jgi:hypothetical protein
MAPLLYQEIQVTGTVLLWSGIFCPIARRLFQLAIAERQVLESYTHNPFRSGVLARILYYGSGTKYE